MARGDYIVENLYQPGYSSFKPSENAPEHFMSKERLVGAGEMGITINPMVANQVGELSKALNQGVVPVEVGALDMKTFETVPKYHWDEMRRKAELADSKLSMHAPVIDPAGFGEQGGWSEIQQQQAERQLTLVAQQATSLSNTESVPVTIHAANAYSGSTFKMEDGTKKYEQLVAVDRETGQLAPVKEEVKWYPHMLDEEGKIQGKTLTVKDQLQALNNTKWSDDLQKLDMERAAVEKTVDKVSHYDRADYINAMTGAAPIYGDSAVSYEKSKIIHTASEQVEQAELSMRTMFNKAYNLAEKSKDKEQMEFLDKAAKGYAQVLRTDSDDEKDQFFQHDPKTRASAVFEMTKALKKVIPQSFVTVESFAKEKASETLANVTYNAYDYVQEQRKLGHSVKAPTISIENLGQGFGFSQTEDLKELVDKTRAGFVNKLVEKGKMSAKEAKKKAEELIGVTFDVGHLNLSKKYGFEDKDLIKEAKVLKDYVKHIHLTDNFGHNDVHLPVGMGNVPVKELLGALGDKEGRIRKINEVGGYVNAFGAPGFREVLEAAGSPIYGSGSGPVWSQSTGFQQSYSGGMGDSLPMINYETFGAGFANLPQALGGVRGPGAGRMGGGF